MASMVIRVATMGSLWTVLTRVARSSDSSYYLKRSKGLMLSMIFEWFI
jgi:hypothetical protein